MPRLPILFIPGFPATELRSGNLIVFPPSQGTLSDPQRKAQMIERIIDLEKLTPGEPIRHIFFGISKQAQSLYDLLSGYGYVTSDPQQFAPVGWDWRKGVDDPQTMTAVRNAFSRLTAASNVIVMVHSTGGLVLRRFLEAEPQWGRRIEQVVAFGVPWGGTLKSLRYLDGEKFGVLNASLSKTQTRRVMSFCQAAFDLLPPPRLAGAPAPPDLAFVGNQAVSPMVNTNWIRPADLAQMQPLATNARRLVRAPDFPLQPVNAPVLPILAQHGIRITNIVGFGAATDTSVKIRGAGDLAFTATDEGDGTVPRVSAEWIRSGGLRTIFVPIGVHPTSQLPDYHSQLWHNLPLLEIYDQIFLGKDPEPFVSASIDLDDAAARGQNGLRVRISAAGVDGQRLPNARLRFEDIRGTITGPLSSVTKTVKVPRANLPNTEGAFGRFRLIVEWSGGQAKEVVLIYRR